MKQLITVFAFLMLFFVAPACAQPQKYTCPMHPHYIADRPGTCPICGMDLVPLDDGGNEPATTEKANQTSPTNMTSAPNGAGKKKILYWRAPMDPNYRSDKPGKSPMGMDLVPVYADEELSEVDGLKTTGLAVVKITPETMQSTGIRTETAQLASFGTLVRSYGDVTENVRLQFDVSARVDGWIEDLKVMAVGDSVLEGELLFKLYSPSLISAQRDYISALQTGINGRIQSASRRLVSLGMQQRVIDELSRIRKPFQAVPFYARTNGLVSVINIREGSYVKPGMSLMTLQSYESVWIDVNVAEKDVPYITKETLAKVSLPALGGKSLPASIDYIYPTIDKATRTGRVRLVLDNKDGRLKPGAYADVEFETNVEKRLSVPGDAILKSKDGDYVVVALGDGRFQPRRVLSGLKYKGYTEILDGLKDGEQVVVSGQFLIDSESALKESFRKMQAMQKPLSGLNVNDDQLAMLDHLIDAAIYMHEEITNGRTPNPDMILPAITLGEHLLQVFRGTKLEFILQDAETALTNAKNNVTDLQWQKSLNDLVIALKPWILEGQPDHYRSHGVQIYMAHGEGKFWIQQGDAAPKNPYGAGHSMKVDWQAQPDAPMTGSDAGQGGVGHE